MKFLIITYHICYFSSLIHEKTKQFHEVILQQVIARRAFLRYLYSEAAKVKQNEESYIFSGLCQNGKCILRNSVKFYFFTSHVPCGDASIIPIKPEENNSIKRCLKRRYEEMLNASQGKRRKQDLFFIKKNLV